MDRIEINPEIMLGKPVIKGTRIPVELLVRKLSEGAVEADLLDAYPKLAREDIYAALSNLAKRHRRSINSETIIQLENVLANPEPDNERRLERIRLSAAGKDAARS